MLQRVSLERLEGLACFPLGKHIRRFNTREEKLFRDPLFSVGRGTRQPTITRVGLSPMGDLSG